MLNSSNSFYLNDKVNKFIDWYYLEYVKGNYTETGEYFLPIELKDFIEKVAVWYELRYPESSVYKKFGENSNNSIDDVVLKYNKNYISSNNFEWEDFYNSKLFFEMLPFSEQSLLLTPVYQELVYLNPNSHMPGPKSGII